MYAPQYGYAYGNPYGTYGRTGRGTYDAGTYGTYGTSSGSRSRSASSIITRLLLALTLAAGLILMATTYKRLKYSAGTYGNSVRIAYIVISATALLVTFLLFLLELCSVILAPLFIFLDLLFMLAMIGISIPVAVLARRLDNSVSGYIREIGLFSAASAMGLFSPFLYIPLMIINAFRLRG